MTPRCQVEITNTAENDIKSIFNHIAGENLQAAAKWIKEIKRQVASLEQFPKRCPTIPESEELGKEYRHLVYGNYRTIFRVKDSTVLILRVIHGAQLLDLEVFKK